MSETTQGASEVPEPAPAHQAQHLDSEGRPEPPYAAGEAPTLLGFLEFQRATLAWKTSGLTTDQLRTPLTPSDLTLAGLLTHLAWVEDFWFGVTLAGQEPAEPWHSLDWDVDQDAEFTTATRLSSDELHALWSQNVDRSREVMQALLAQYGEQAMEQHFAAWGGRQQVSLRWVVTHLVEEYARHNGHADLLREALDGSVGE